MAITGGGVRWTTGRKMCNIYIGSISVFPTLIQIVGNNTCNVWEMSACTSLAVLFIQRILGTFR